ncbi:MAG: hypothetical protein JXM70_20795 [Pirellulales bacterium]|nr:hypothetical protein [Pirellulales bacterium]
MSSVPSIKNYHDGTTFRGILSDLLRRNPAARFADLGRELLTLAGGHVPENDYDVCRTMTSNAAMGDAISSAAGSTLITGAEREPDTTLSWTHEKSAENFKENELFGLATGGRLELQPRGGIATEADYELVKNTYRLGRFTTKIEVDEQDMIDSDRPLNAVMMAVEQKGAEAQRVRSDLVYSLVHENPAMAYDSVALFHSDHSNLGTAVLGTAGLATVMGSIGNQVLSDEEGDSVHVNNSGRFLIVPPDLEEPARRLVRNVNLGDSSDIKVLKESRLGAAGLVDPRTDDIRTGTTTNWMMAGASHARPSIVVLALNGNFRPRLTRYALDRGRWGFGWNIKLDLAVVAVDHQPLYFSDGTV